jgi:hypothetical protein
MIPNISILTEEITETNYPSNTYKIVFSAKNDPIQASRGVMALSLSAETEEVDRINGYVDDLEAVVQAVYLILSTERYQFIIYSWDYGVELIDLIGKPMPYVMSELPRRITEALTQDNRIENVVDFKFEQNGKRLHTTFTVVSNVGNISTELEVEV